MSQAASGPVHDLGWRNSSPQAALAFLPPVLLSDFDPPDPGLLAAAGLGGVAEQIVVVRASFNLHLRFTKPGAPRQGFVRVGEPGGLSDQAFRALVTPIKPTAQRQPDVPALQLSLNLIMVTEAPLALHLAPPFLSPEYRRWPGPLVSGRFPLRSWPRPLNAVLEWQDREREWRLRRGDPIAYLWVQYHDPSARPRLVEAATTPALKRHLARVDNVSAFGRNVGPMFEEAERRRPTRLLTPKTVAGSRADPA